MANFCSECGKALEQGVNFCTNCGASTTGKPSVKAQWSDKSAKPARTTWSGGQTADRRERVLGKTQGGKQIRLKTILMTAAAIIAGAWIYTSLPESGNPIIKASPVVTNPVFYGGTPQQMAAVSAKVERGKVILPFDIVREKKIVRFVYGDPRYGIPLLAYISTEGKVITAISVCEPCNSTAFHIQDDKIICNSCGTTWKLDNLEAVSGSCGRYPPDPLPNTVTGNQIQIDEQTVATWQRRV